MLLKAKDTAERIGYSYSYFIKTLQFDRDFPKPVRITHKSRPRWREQDLEDWETFTLGLRKTTEKARSC